jgi:mannan endo-1,4-beta-mannosidase
MFRHVHDIFEAQGIDSAHLQFMWVPNCSGPYRAEDFYPGDAYVDWVGLDGYNFGTYSGGKWMTPAYRLDNMVGRLKALTNKPIALAETGSSAHTSTGTSYSAKDQWIKDVFAYALQNDIRMVLYFNRDVGADFTMFGGSEGTGTYTYGTTKYNVFTGYKQAISPSSVIPSDPNNPRLLTDSQFAGKL